MRVERQVPVSDDKVFAESGHRSGGCTILRETKAVL